jgi:hypothetical protein
MTTYDDFTYDDFAYNDFTYNDFTYWLLMTMLITLITNDITYNWFYL